jgi:CelD/BcsL family acetyltransferase involved in cellulose biosynthesis
MSEKKISMGRRNERASAPRRNRLAVGVERRGGAAKDIGSKYENYRNDEFIGDNSAMPPALFCHYRSEALGSKLPEWLAFAERCHLAAPFCGPRVWEAWFRARPGSEPAVFEWRRDGELRALLALERRGSHLEMACSMRLDYQDIAALDHESGVALLRAVLEEESRRCSALVFPQVAAGSRLAAVLADERVAEAAHVESRYWGRCPVATIPRREGLGFEAALPARQRKDFRNAARRLAEALPAHVSEHHGPGRIPPALLDEAAALHVANQHRKEGPSVLADPAFLGFLKTLGSDDSPLCLSLLRPAPGAAPIAFHLGWFDGATFYDYLTAYDGEHASLSPGRWLLTSALGHWHARAEGSEIRLDLLCGEEPYKSRWPVSPYFVSRVVLLPRRLANLPRILGYAAVYGLKNARNRRRPDRAACTPRREPSLGDLALPR